MARQQAAVAPTQARRVSDPEAVLGRLHALDSEFQRLSALITHLQAYERAEDLLRTLTKRVESLHEEAADAVEKCHLAVTALNATKSTADEVIADVQEAEGRLSATIAARHDEAAAKAEDWRTATSQHLDEEIHASQADLRQSAEQLRGTMAASSAEQRQQADEWRATAERQFNEAIQRQTEWQSTWQRGVEEEQASRLQAIIQVADETRRRYEQVDVATTRTLGDLAAKVRDASESHDQAVKRFEQQLARIQMIGLVVVGALSALSLVGILLAVLR